MNAAAPAVRVPYSTTWFDYDLSAGASLPGAFARTDFDNHGDFANIPSHARAGDFVDLNVGGTLQFGKAGASATGDLQQFTLTTSSPSAPGLSMQIGRWTVLGAYAFFEGRLAVGAGARVLTLQVSRGGGGALLTMTGVAPEIGALWMPTGMPWRIGATARGGVEGGAFGKGNVTTDAATGVRSAGAFILPSQIVMPWEVDMGVAYQLGPRPLNPAWQDPHEQEAASWQHAIESRELRARARQVEIEEAPAEERASRAAVLDAEEARLRALEEKKREAERQRLRDMRKARYANWPREKILILASALLTGPSTRAISVEGFLDQRVETVGRALTVTPRFGLEGEPLRDRAIVRVGSYVEPSRYDGTGPRQHFTFGSDIRLFPFEACGLFPGAQWKVSLVLDIAPRYTNGGIGFGIWH